MGKEENQEVRKVTDVDWEAVDDVLETIIENINVGSSELCELRAFDLCRELNTEVLPTLKNMVTRVRVMHRGGELPELDTGMLGESIRVLTRDETRDVLESGEFGKAFDTNPGVRAAGAVAGDMIMNTETDTYYHVVRGNDLPARGTGLETGTAEDRRAGVPRTEEERRLRHEELYGEEEELF